MTNRQLTPALAQRLIMDATPWLSCDGCFAVVDEYVQLLIADPNYRDPAMSAHLRGCAACAEEARSLLELAAGDAGVDPAPLLQRIATP
ncbi:MAG TPA: hypothetical protein VH395_15655 [Jatrophihabitantaceae bacterium]